MALLTFGLHRLGLREAQTSAGARMAKRRRPGEAATFLLSCGGGKAFRLESLYCTYFLYKKFEEMIPSGRNYFCHGERIFCMIEIVWIDFSQGSKR
ncbi:hypothetical protein [Agrobacterium sp. T29]|uniref:hypothetical protein n=1 Tax=Agrobacterium sp. T29 TaxID=2580515 RepID=UPI00143CC942|nr:hypothetical protein [Agrobacterium sp. T29]